jgi:hypothetical protein
MKNQIKEKFLGVKHKWIYYHIDSNTFQSILDKISAKVHAKEVKSKVAINLVKCFKKQEKVFLKFIKTVGRKNFICECNLIDNENNKIIINLSPEVLLDAHILSGTPKGLKLYKTGEKSKGNWKKPDDGFFDPVSYPPVEEELTELGYAMYKDWTDEVRASGLSSIDYIRKSNGTSKYFKRNVDV